MTPTNQIDDWNQFFGKFVNADRWESHLGINVSFSHAEAPIEHA